MLPVRNGAGTVDRAIRSVVGQTWIDWELVVVDDGSTDGTVGMVHGWSKMDPRVRLIAAPATGLVAALIRGVSESRGELVARMDSDDEMKPERLAQQVAYLATHETVELVSCGVEFGGDREAHAGYAAHVDWLNSVVTSVQIMCARFVESPLAHPSVMWRREVWAEHGGYRDGEFPEDYELWLRWLDAGCADGQSAGGFDEMAGLGRQAFPDGSTLQPGGVLPDKGAVYFPRIGAVGGGEANLDRGIRSTDAQTRRVVGSGGCWAHGLR